MVIVTKFEIEELFLNGWAIGTVDMQECYESSVKCSINACVCETQVENNVAVFHECTNPPCIEDWVAYPYFTHIIKHGYPSISKEKKCSRCSKELSIPDKYLDTLKVLETLSL